MNDSVRVQFEKTGRARYISHLDLQHTIQRGFSRAGIAIRHSNGFNPHPQMSIALPLPLGCESVCEIMDFAPETVPDLDRLTEEMNEKLPEGIRFVKAYLPSRKVSEIRWIRTEGIWRYDDAAPLEELRTLFLRDSLPVEKKTKRGMAEIDLAAAVRDVCFTPSEQGVHMTALLSAQEPTVNPDLLVKAADRHLDGQPVPEAVLFRRLELLDSEGNVFH
ncbi:MAG: TIGR03936 family radical SAM-associated protein [Oscillospiraceae bacterium]|nr:TIGR03936 family radical SAM-associated protein [Oscillospiraceae bacterium]